MAPGRIDPEPAVSSQSLQSLQSVTSDYDDVLRFYLNGTKVVLDESIDPEITLLEYLRGIGLTGTKLGCAEGGKEPLQKGRWHLANDCPGCGACTVVCNRSFIIRCHVQISRGSIATQSHYG